MGPGSWHHVWLERCRPKLNKSPLPDVIHILQINVLSKSLLNANVVFAFITIPSSVFQVHKKSRPAYFR